jgi:hypothetical protein
MNLEKQDDFGSKKKAYFSRLAVEMMSALRLHATYGLWGPEGTKADWRNVSQHCLVEAARAREFAKLIGLSAKVSSDLEIAAALHDFNKPEEIRATREGGITWETTEQASAVGDMRMRESNISEEIITLVNAVAHTSLEKTNELLQKETLTDEEIAYLIMHYIDDYTVENAWAEPAENMNGKLSNSLDKRIAKNKANERYVEIDRAGFERFGMSSYEYQLHVGEKVEQRLTNTINEKTGKNILPKELPHFIDSLIKEDIEKG